MYAMNFEFQFWLDMSTILAYISREPQKLLYVLQWGEQVSAKTSVMHMAWYSLKKKGVRQQDPETPGRSPETPVRESRESSPSEPEHRNTKKQIVTQLK